MRMFQAHLPKRVNRVRCSPDARTLSVVLRGQTAVNHFATVDGERALWGPSHRSELFDLGYSADGNLLAVATIGVVWAYDRPVMTDDQGRFVSRAQIHPGFQPERMRTASLELMFSPSPHPLQCWLGVAGSELHLWRPHDQQRIVAPDEGDYRGVSFGPDGTTVASIEYHAHALCVWNVKPFRVLFRTDLKGINTFDNGSVAMMPDGERVIVAAGELLRCVPLHGTGGWDTPVKKPPLEIALHPRGHTLLVADGSKKVTAYDTSNGKAAAQYDWGVGKVGCVTYSPDGTLAAAGGEKGQVVVWDAE
jgi:WD40 repeat protein